MPGWAVLLARALDDVAILCGELVPALAMGPQDTEGSKNLAPRPPEELSPWLYKHAYASTPCNPAVMSCDCTLSSSAKHCAKASRPLAGLPFVHPCQVLESGACDGRCSRRAAADTGSAHAHGAGAGAVTRAEGQASPLHRRGGARACGPQ